MYIAIATVWLVYPVAMAVSSEELYLYAIFYHFLTGISYRYACTKGTVCSYIYKLARVLIPNNSKL